MSNQSIALTLGFTALLFSVAPAQALPGQTTDEVAAWIRANPTLRTMQGEKFLVRKSSTPAQRFTFEASLQSPGRIAPPAVNAGIVRSETLALFDMVRGVSPDRLGESLRNLYGTDVFQDYNLATVIYSYPTAAAIQQAMELNTPLQAAIQGELRLGSRFAYWWEIAQTAKGYPYSGRIVVFLREDLNKLEAELRNR